MDSLVTFSGPAQALSSVQIAGALLLSFVLTGMIATVYRWTFQGFSYSRSFVHTMILGGMIVALLIMAIGNNLARGLGILGTLAIIRFRTPVRDPRDMIFLFGCLGIGIACGANVYNVAIIGTVAIAAAALVLHWSPFASGREHEALLRLLAPPGSPAVAAVEDVLRDCCSEFHLIGMREAVQGDMMEFSYQVKLLDPTGQPTMINRLRDIKAVQDPSLLMRRTTVEL